MHLTQKVGLSGLVIGCAIASFEDGIRILTLLSTLALASYVSAARKVDRPTKPPEWRVTPESVNRELWRGLRRRIRIMLSL